MSLNAKTSLVTSIITRDADDYDGHRLRKLVDKDLIKGIEAGTVAADEDYDGGESHYYLSQKVINSAIRPNNYRTKKKEENKEGWAKLKESYDY